MGNSIVDRNKWKGWAAVGIGTDLFHLEELYKEGECLFGKKLDEFNSEFEQKTKNFDQEEKAEYGDFMSDEYWKLSDTFPQTFRSALFITCFARLEYELIDICKSIYHRNNNFGEPIIKKDKIVKCKLYLVNNVEFSENVFSEEWSNILVYRAIRNSITHNDRFIKEGGSVESFFNRHPTIGSIKQSKILLKEGFCEQVIKDINEQLLLIYNYMYKNDIKTFQMTILG